jgi:hypothetical protein
MIVVIRENGDVEWTKQFENVIILNKGEHLSDEYNYINIPNTQKEYHTMFSYICDNYDNLENHTIFVIVDDIERQPITSKFINRIKYYFKNDAKNVNFEFITDFKQKIHTTSIIECDDDPQKLEDFNNVFKRVYKELFNIVEYKHIYKADGRAFIVSKKNIGIRNKNFYRRIIELLEQSENQYENYVIEAIIEKIFTDRYTNFPITCTEKFNDPPCSQQCEPEICSCETIETIPVEKKLDTNIDCPNCMNVFQNIPKCESYYCSEECYNKINNPV